MMRLIAASIFMVGLLTAQTVSSQADMARQFSTFQQALSDQRARIIAKQEKMTALRSQVEWNDLFYIEHILKSLTIVDICLYYQSELAAVCAEITASGNDYGIKHLPGLLEQGRFTRSKLDAEYKAILLRSLQIIHPDALALVFSLKENLTDARQTVDAYIRWLEKIQIKA